MSSSYAAPTDGWDFSHQLERMSVCVTKATCYIGYLLVLFGSSAVMTVTFGMPYLHYKLYRFSGSDSSEGWLELVKSLEALWDHYCHLPLHMLPILFPMVSSSGLSLCSTATFLATMTLTVGVISVATSSIYKLNAKALHNERAVDEWLKASQPAWREVPNKSFWIFMSLPAFTFFLSVSLFFSTVILTVWERSAIDMTPSLKILNCSPNKLQSFKVIFLVVLVPIITHFVFILAKMRSITILRAAEVATA